MRNICKYWEAKDNNNIKSETQQEMKIVGDGLEEVTRFKYFGGIVTSERNLDDKINERKKMVFFTRKEVPKQTKSEVIKRRIKPILIFWREALTIT